MQLKLRNLTVPLSWMLIGMIVRSRQIDWKFRPKMLHLADRARAPALAAVSTTRNTTATAVVVSKTTGSIRVYRDGNMLSRFDPRDD